MSLSAVELMAQQTRNHIQRSDRVTHNPDDSLVLCVDAGGSSCKAIAITRDGRQGIGIAGPCNISNFGIDAAVTTISAAVQEAVNSITSLKGCSFRSLTFSSVWVGLAGYDRPNLRPRVDATLSKLFRLSVDDHLRVSTDIDLIPTTFAAKRGVDSVIVLIAGTGSIAMSYVRRGDQFVRTGRFGGWGHLLGDDGSGYAIGREALRKALSEADRYRMRKAMGVAIGPLTPLTQAIMQHFRTQYPACELDDLLSTILVPGPMQQMGEQSYLARIKRIASVARVVLPMAEYNEEARRIVQDGAASLAQLVKDLLETQKIELRATSLILAGGLTQDTLYRTEIVQQMEKMCGNFEGVHTVNQPAMAVAQYLAQKQFMQQD